MCSKIMVFLTDDDFINHVLDAAPQLDSQWETYFSQHPEQIVDAEEARVTLLAPADIVCNFSTSECDILKDRIVNSIKKYLLD